MTTILIVLALGALGALCVGIVIWAITRKPGQSSNAPREADTAWNDPITPASPDETRRP
jgi:hypothetical protein